MSNNSDETHWTLVASVTESAVGSLSDWTCVASPQEMFCHTTIRELEAGDHVLSAPVNPSSDIRLPDAFHGARAT